MNSFSRRSRHSRLLFRPWLWLLLAIFSACCPVEASAPDSLCRSAESAEFLCSPTASTALAAPAVKMPPAKDPLPAPMQPASLAGTNLLLPVHSFRTLLAGESSLLPLLTAVPAPFLPRPPPLG